MQGPGQRAAGGGPAAQGSRSGTGMLPGVRAMAGQGVSGTAGTAGVMATAGGGGTGQQARPGYTPSGTKIGRNDACWCGSGRKYKKCHGA